MNTFAGDNGDFFSYPLIPNIFSLGKNSWLSNREKISFVLMDCHMLARNDTEYNLPICLRIRVVGFCLICSSYFCLQNINLIEVQITDESPDT